MIKFSIVVPTIARREQFKLLVESIYRMKNSYEVIIVDQNQDGLIDDICNYYKLEGLIHLKVDFKGAAEARNYGFHRSNGDVIVFPDDDSELTIDLLKNVEKILLNQKCIDILFGRVQDKNLKADVNFERFETKVNFKNMFHTTSECTMFIKRKVFYELDGFDKTFGVGTYYGADEGADLFLRSMYKGYNLVYNPNVIFFHPQKVKNNYGAECKRAYSYGKGFGRLIIKHIIKYKQYRMIKLFIKFQTRALGGCLLGMITLNFGQVQYYEELIRGRLVGVYKSAYEYFYKEYKE